MQVELLKDIVHSLIGERSKGVVELLVDNVNVNEFIIAKKLGLTINQTRNLLYKLLDEGLVSVIRKKNKKKGGWYDHFWTLDLGKTLTKFKENLMVSLDKVRSEISIKKNTRFYYCESCGIELNEEQALLQEYTCAECGQLLTLKDNQKDLQALEKERARFEKDLIEVNFELDIIHSKEAKSKERRIKADDKKKAKEKLLRKKERARLAGKTMPVVKPSKRKKTSKK